MDDLQLIHGSIDSFLADCGRSFNITGRLLEIAPHNHGRAARCFPGAHISTLDSDPQSGATYIADLCQYNDRLIPTSFFDWVLCTEVLERVVDPFAAVRELNRLLKPGGHAFITTSFNVAVGGPSPDFWRFTEHGLRVLLKDFTIVSLEQVDASGAVEMPAYYRAVIRKNPVGSPPGQPTAPEFSAAITCYNEEHSIDEFHARLSKALSGLGRSYEIIFINDGSADRTFEKLRDIFDRDPNVSAIADLFRNSGQAAAITAAISESRGRVILLMDSDLQLEPEELPLLVREYDKGFDVVSGARRDRRDSWLRVVPSKLANIIMRKATQSEFSDFGCTFKLFNARLVRAFEYGPHRIFSNVDLIARAARRCEIPVTHHARRYGKSGWTFRKLFRYNMDNIVSLSERPFQILAILCLSFATLFGLRILMGTVLPIRILGSVTNGLLLNVILISLLITVGIMSMIGEFAIRSFVIGRNLPFYVIREVQRRAPGGDPST